MEGAFKNQSGRIVLECSRLTPRTVTPSHRHTLVPSHPRTVTPSHRHTFLPHASRRILRPFVPQSFSPFVPFVNNPPPLSENSPNFASSPCNLFSYLVVLNLALSSIAILTNENDVIVAAEEDRT